MGYCSRSTTYGRHEDFVLKQGRFFDTLITSPPPHVKSDLMYVWNLVMANPDRVLKKRVSGFDFKKPGYPVKIRPKLIKKIVDICAFLGLKILKIGNPGTRVLRLKNLTRSIGRNPGFKPGLGTRVPSLVFDMISFVY